jgi:hypothetical protein
MVTYSTDFGAFAAIGRLHIKHKMDKQGRNYPHMHICEFVDSMSMDSHGHAAMKSKRFCALPAGDWQEIGCSDGISRHTYLSIS